VPIAIVDEVGATPLDALLSLDRRGDRRDRPSGTWESLKPVPLDWEMAPPAEGTAATRGAPARFPERPRPPPRPAAPLPDFDVDPDVEVIEVHRVRAQAWRRVVAWIVDGAILAALVALLLLPVLGKADLVSPRADVLVPAAMVVALVAFAYQWLGVTLMGATPGMRLVGLRVVGPDGERPSPGRSAARALLALVAAALLGVGLLLALFTRSGQGAHDVVARTWVVQGMDGGRRR
jgi:uncharacterized RDD family membrane protein YckC